MRDADAEQALMLARFKEVCRLYSVGVWRIKQSLREEFPGIDDGWLGHFCRLRLGHHENEYEGHPKFRVVYQRPESLDRPTTPCPARLGDQEADVNAYVGDIRSRANQPPPGFGRDWRLDD